MKKILSFALLFVCVLTSCKKSEDKSPLPDLLLADLSAQMDAVTEISDFNSSIKKLSLTAAETEGGITVFAPHDFSVITFNGTSILHVIYTNEQLKDHIVKGKYTLADLRTKTKLVTISGKTLIITNTDNNLSINGVSLIDENVVSVSSGIVHVLEKAIDITYPESPGEIGVRELTESDFKLSFEAVKTSLEAFQKSVLVMDALLSNEATGQQAQQAGYGQYQDFSGFKFTPSSYGVDDVWKKGYQIITRTNSILKAKSVDFSKKEELIAGLKTIRAYAYLRLLNYYGNLPISPEVYDASTPPPSNTNKQVVLDYIYADLTAADLILEPLGKSPEINTYTVKALIAKLALHEKNYEKVIANTNKIINSNSYSIESADKVFSNDSREIIWSLTALPDGNLKTFLNNRQAFPLLRLSEIYLMRAEAQLAQAKPEMAAQSLKALLGPEEINDQVTATQLQNLWLSQMTREGISFINMKRWGIASQKLTGFNHERFNLLPIPEREIMLSATMVQNFGYPY